MIWWAIEVRVPEADRDEVARWMVEQTGQAAEQREDGTVVGFLADESGARLLAESLHAWREDGPGIALRQMPEMDWGTAWRTGLAPRRIGRLVVTPSWLADPAASGLQLVIDPEQAFGTGEHGSTRTVLALMQERIPAGSTVLDLGSGSGILAIAAAKLGAGTAIGIESDPVAVPIAEENARRNRVADRVRFIEGEAATLVPLLGPVALVMSNILREPNVELLPLIRPALSRGGAAVFSGMEPTDADRFRSALREHGFAAVEELVDEGWWGVTAVPA